MPQFILAIEQALAAYTLAAALPEGVGPLPAGFRIFPAHAGELIPENVTDFLVIQSGRPGGELLAAGNPELLVEFQLYTGQLTNETARPGAVVIHDQRAALLEWIWGPENFDAALAALNAPLTDAAHPAGFGVGFSGWAAPDDAPGDDGRTDNQFVAKVRRLFSVF